MLPNQLSTIEEATSIAAKLTSVGGGVAEIYIPEFMGPFSTPQNGSQRFHHYRFNNGAEGFNVGIIRSWMETWPNRWLMMLALEVNYTAPSNWK